MKRCSEDVSSLVALLEYTSEWVGGYCALCMRNAYGLVSYYSLHDPQFSLSLSLSFATYLNNALAACILCLLYSRYAMWQTKWSHYKRKGGATIVTIHCLPSIESPPPARPPALVMDKDQRVCVSGRHGLRSYERLSRFRHACTGHGFQTWIPRAAVGSHNGIPVIEHLEERAGWGHTAPGRDPGCFVWPKTLF